MGSNCQQRRRGADVPNKFLGVPASSGPRHRNSSQLFLLPHPFALGSLRQQGFTLCLGQHPSPRARKKKKKNQTTGLTLPHAPGSLARLQQGDVAPILLSSPPLELHPERTENIVTRPHAGAGLCVQHRLQVPKAARDPLSRPNSPDASTPSCCPAPPARSPFSVSSSPGLGSSRL